MKSFLTPFYFFKTQKFQGILYVSTSSSLFPLRLFVYLENTNHIKCHFYISLPEAVCHHGEVWPSLKQKNKERRIVLSLAGLWCSITSTYLCLQSKTTQNYSYKITLVIVFLYFQMMRSLWQEYSLLLV